MHTLLCVSLPLSATSKLLNTHDFPVLLAQFIESPPWTRRHNGQLQSHVLVIFSCIKITKDCTTLKLCPSYNFCYSVDFCHTMKLVIFLGSMIVDQESIKSMERLFVDVVNILSSLQYFDPVD